MPIMLRFFRFIPVFVVISVVILPLNARSSDHPTIRVAIQKNVSSVTIRATRGYLTVSYPQSGERSWRGKEAVLRVINGGLRVNGSPVAGDEIMIKGKPALYRIGNGKYRGAIRVHVLSGNELLVVNELDIEDYLAGLINSEISSNWPNEAVKAQAVAARTYALYQLSGTTRYKPSALYDLESTVADQVYHGAHREDLRAYRGVRATTGQVLTREGVVFPSFYHSTCGGYTEKAQNVWVGMKGQSSGVDRFCRRSPYSAWFLRMPRDEFLTILTRAGVIGEDKLVVRISIEPFPDSPRVDRLILATDGEPIAIKATELRRIIGYNRLKSTWFNVGFEGDQVVFAGRGFGHGVGLCQWGAKGMAEAGYSYKEILKHYYPDAEIGRMY